MAEDKAKNLPPLYEATKEAFDLAMEKNKPELIGEAINGLYEVFKNPYKSKSE